MYPLEDVFPIENGGYSIAILVYRRVAFWRLWIFRRKKTYSPIGSRKNDFIWGQIWHFQILLRRNPPALQTFSNKNDTTQTRNPFRVIKRKTSSPHNGPRGIRWVMTEEQWVSEAMSSPCANRWGNPNIGGRQRGRIPSTTIWAGYGHSLWVLKLRTLHFLLWNLFRDVSLGKMEIKAIFCPATSSFPPCGILMFLLPLLVCWKAFVRITETLRYGENPGTCGGLRHCGLLRHRKGLSFDCQSLLSIEDLLTSYFWKRSTWIFALNAWCMWYESKTWSLLEFGLREPKNQWRWGSLRRSMPTWVTRCLVQILGQWLEVILWEHFANRTPPPIF